MSNLLWFSYATSDATQLCAFRYSARVFLLGAVVSWVGCQGPTDPTPSNGIAIVVGGDAGQALALSLPGGNVVARNTSLPAIQDAFALSADRATLFVSALNSVNDRSLFTLSVGSLSVTRSRQFSELDSQSEVAGLRVLGNYAITVTPDGQHLLVADAELGTQTGIAVLRRETGIPVRFIGPFFVAPHGLLPRSPSPDFPNGLILLLGTRPNDGTAATERAFLFVLDGVSLAVRDSVAVGQPVSNIPRGDLEYLRLHPNGRDLFFRDGQTLYKYDLVEARIEASSQVAVPGPIALSTDGGELYVMDAGDGRFDPGSGHVLVFDAGSMQSLGSIDLRSAAVDGVNPVLGNAVVSHDENYLYVLTGTASRGPLFGPQPRRVIVVELATKQVVKIVALGDWGSGEIFLR